ncbi:hypothetical protein Pth03_63540 [Planotetraspora thailandica]|uniref:Uncharacterized protein n=1 Tax=Planotetraspora thailandica TaxID=487172 RepID=A0A8J3XYU9_9ACTN|nr:hypothetical protein [Planotetraspora thailandica]GII57965.1 hypothetical protein Pth03_63540 [Planotetraspora thailandica]
MDMDKIRLRVEEMSRLFGVKPPAVIHGEPPEGADCILKRRGKYSLIVVGDTFDALPERLQDADIAWVVAASDAKHVRKDGVSMRRALVIGLVIGTLVAPFVILYDSFIPLLIAVVAVVVVMSPYALRQRMYGLDRRVAKVCGEEMVRHALSYWEEHPPQMRGLYRLVLKLQPSMAKRAARLASANQ